MYIVKGPRAPSTASPAWTTKVISLTPVAPSSASEPDIIFLDLTPGSPRPVPPVSDPSPSPVDVNVTSSDLNVQVWRPFRVPNPNADGKNAGKFPNWILPYLNGQNGGQMGYPGVGGAVIPQCSCCCCQCGVPSVGMAPPLLDQVMPVAQDSQGVVQDTQDRRLFQRPETPGCPWDCLIDETVPTRGRSNEDDALYEIFYSNPLNCCGTIVEVGAGDGLQFSTSYFFEKGMNWTAHLIEADPLEYGRIADNRSGEKVKTVNGAFCNESPYLYFDEESRTFQSASKGDHASELMSYDFEVTNSTKTVNCIRLDSELANIDHVNVLIIRVKGDPWAVIRTMNWNIRVDIWVILMEVKTGVTLDTIRATLRLHDYVPAAWDIKLWCETPTNCMENEVWLRKNFNPIHNPLLQEHRGLRGVNRLSWSGMGA